MQTVSPLSPKPRTEELDFLRAVFILLMIAFHLVYFGDGYPRLKSFVYTFHMPGFLLISGYLLNLEKEPGRFFRSMRGLLLPYLIMESGYILMAAILPIRDHVDNLTPLVFADKMALHPLGPYWYLHTLMLCGCLSYVACRYLRLRTLPRLMLTAVALYGLSVLGLVSFPCAMYFLAGVAIRTTRCPFTTLFRATGWAVLPLALLCLHPEHFDRSSIGGVMIVGLVISLLLWLFPFVKGKLRRGMLFLGRNTLPLYIFSPLFTICCKALVPLFSFDPTRLLFLVVSLAVCTAGSLLVCRACDMLRLSPLLFGRKSLLT